MYYILIRISCLIVLSILVIYLYKNCVRNKKIKNNTFAIILVTSTIIFITLVITPVENMFFSFDTAEEAFAYSHREKIFGIAYGKNSAMILYNIDKTTYSYCIIPKKEEKWKLDSYFTYKEVLNKYFEDKKITLYKHRSSNDYYIIINHLDTNKEKELNITDNMNSKFELYSKDINSKQVNANIYYTYIDNIVKDYTLTINDKNMSLF